MPRYFFHVINGEPSADGEGYDLPDDAAARVEAVRMAGEILKGRPLALLNVGGLVLDVRDEQGACRFVLDVRAMEGIPLEAVEAV
ncbi:hypothetical protein J8J14_20990 [Roseomonas sp. SSH11]|uniref:DUF6894 domain-containing protein n=1 Tax=Pararoseomonas baculiformis TaxID=2820812 RepID=A0ABS4AJN6_9PROT|nr:hypothetical protein [Pararoseomonas baculiformis]MBP0447253.1 hypothetical protein [Pararoseomonas baculiformis]